MLSTKCRQGKVGLLTYPADNRTTMMKIPCKSVFLLLHRIIRFFFSCINALWAKNNGQYPVSETTPDIYSPLP